MENSVSLLDTRKPENETHKKDIKRYSHSRIDMFRRCPRRHHYTYVEQLPEEENEFLIVGSLFHKCAELYYEGKDYSKPIREFKKLSNSGRLNLDKDLLEEVFDAYTAFYDEQDSKETVLMVEGELRDELEDDDYMIMYVDRVVRTDDGLNILRDTKTTLNKLKYEYDDVAMNQQLLLYLPYIEKELDITIDAIEIDEVRVAALQPVPKVQNGNPSTDKKKLELVTYESYRNALEEIGLENDPKYQNIQDYLEKRGHPLYRRTRVQILDRNIIDTNLQEYYETYRVMKTFPNYMVRSPLCRYCPFKKLCDLDAYNIGESERENLKKTFFPD